MPLRIDPPTWANLDFGFENDEGDTLMAFPKPVAGPIGFAESQFAFPGVDGLWSMDLGRRGRPILWQVEVWVKNLSVLTDWEVQLEDLLNAQTFEMVLHGRTYYDVQLKRIEPAGPLIALADPWLAAKQINLMFLEHNP